ncbi:hypothetical protein CLU79DRAFT_349234 [Phycomyces nitens]|nr:hypothetical protein CLU79DRAFT_349234 [Phycomyces nitens]
MACYTLNRNWQPVMCIQLLNNTHWFLVQISHNSLLLGVEAKKKRKSELVENYLSWTKLVMVNQNKIKRKKKRLPILFGDKLMAAITTYLQRHRDSLKTFTRDGRKLVCYARKSSTDDDIENSARLIQLIVGNLKGRSFATRLYVSTPSWVFSPFAKRDLKPDSKVIESMENINGKHSRPIGVYKLLCS